jgi:hypothetical protein
MGKKLNKNRGTKVELMARSVSSRQFRLIPWYTLASEISLTAACSTMFLMTNRLIALSLGTHRAQLEQRTAGVCPRPFLLRPPDRLFLV